MATPEIGAYNRAAIAEELAELSEPDADAVLDARRLAWRSSPDVERLLVLHHAAAQLGDPTRAMAEELATPSPGSLPRPWDQHCLAACCCSPVRRNGPRSCCRCPPDTREIKVSGTILVPYLLVSVSRALGGAKDAIDWALGFLTTVNRGFGVHRWFGNPSPKESRRWRNCSRHGLEAALEQLGHDVDAIGSNKRRGEYPRAAEMLAAGTRAQSLARGDDAGQAWFRDWFTRYPRHVAFRRELEKSRPGAASMS